MESTMIKLPELSLEDESEMRAFYESCGMSQFTIEAAIKARRDQPVEEEIVEYRTPRPSRKASRSTAARKGGGNDGSEFSR